VQDRITHVIDCRSEFDDRSLIQGFNQTRIGPTNPRLKTLLQYLYNGAPDDDQPKPPEWFGKSIDFALHALSHRHTRVYVHCAAGINRGPSTAFAILLALGFDSGATEALIRRCRPKVGLRYKNDAITAVEKLGYF
jgi:protein-tyrosine phosphatase